MRPLLKSSCRRQLRGSRLQASAESRRLLSSRGPDLLHVERVPAAGTELGTNVGVLRVLNHRDTVFIEVVLQQLNRLRLFHPSIVFGAEDVTVCVSTCSREAAEMSPGSSSHNTPSVGSPVVPVRQVLPSPPSSATRVSVRLSPDFSHFRNVTAAQRLSSLSASSLFPRRPCLLLLLLLGRVELPPPPLHRPPEQRAARRPAQRRSSHNSSRMKEQSRSGGKRLQLKWWGGG